MQKKLKKNIQFKIFNTFIGGGVYSPFPELLIMSNLISERHFSVFQKKSLEDIWMI